MKTETTLQKMIRKIRYILSGQAKKQQQIDKIFNSKKIQKTQ